MAHEDINYGPEMSVVPGSRMVRERHGWDANGQYRIREKNTFLTVEEDAYPGPRRQPRREDNFRPELPISPKIVRSGPCSPQSRGATPAESSGGCWSSALS